MTQTATSLSSYYQRIIRLMLETYAQEFASKKPGHCMKITGFGANELEYLWDLLRDQYPGLSTYIIADEKAGERYISATKLIERRNQQADPLLVLIPANSRTAAEDSYGNATFKEIRVSGLEGELKVQLLAEVAEAYKPAIHEILASLKPGSVTTADIIAYLIALSDDGYSDENVGNSVYLLNMIPDSILLSASEKIKYRLNSNQDSIGVLSSFDRPLNDRIGELPLKPKTIQKGIVGFLKKEREARTASSICRIIHQNYSNLNFANWTIPDLDFQHIKLTVEHLKSSDLKEEGGDIYLVGKSSKVTKLRVRIWTNPKPKDVVNLRYFVVKLMAVNGGAGEEMMTLRKAKNSASPRGHRDITVELNPNIIEEGSYFLKVLAEDEFGTVLNFDDRFKEPAVQAIWEETELQDEEANKVMLNRKLTCDSEDFYYSIDNASQDEAESEKKVKLKNVLQAYFRFRIDRLKNGEEAVVPVSSEDSDTWINDSTRKLVSTYHIHYATNQNFQISLSTKLREIEEVFLKNANNFGFVDATLDKNSSVAGFSSIEFRGSQLNSMIPQPILKLRNSIFSRIRASNKAGNGVFETANIFSFDDEIKEYIRRFTQWTTALQNQMASDELATEERQKLQQFLTELQLLDMARVRSYLPNGNKVEALLMSPLHPLRLAWTSQLIEVFHDWEEKTQAYPGYQKDWPKKLERFFTGALIPENSPLVLVKPDTFKSYHYGGELCFGWGLYLRPNEKAERGSFTSIKRQLTHFLRVSLNVTKDNFVESDVSQQLVVRHFKNYLLQHPYTDKLIINLFNAGEAGVFADALVALEADDQFRNVKYEVRIFKGEDRIIEHGEGLRNLINPEYNISEEAEAFSQPSQNRLFPKLRFSVNQIRDYLKSPSDYSAHLSFLISPFPVTDELIKLREDKNRNNFYLNGLITDPTVAVEVSGKEVKWNKFIVPNSLMRPYGGAGATGIKLFASIQSFIAGALASRVTQSIPATKLVLQDRDKVLLSHLHDYSDWVVTFDKNIGPQVFDQPAKSGDIPFLLDYVPGEEVSGISSYLTTRPTSEVLGLLGPHFEEFGLDIHKPDDEVKVKGLLEDLRAVSSSLVLQLNSTKNKAFEVIGSAFAKRVLEKKGYLAEAFLIPVDLHQHLFEDLNTESRKRADTLLVSIDPDKREILINVIELKCRTSLAVAQKEELRIGMKEQILNTIEALRFNFDPEYHLSHDRLDREIKNKELRSLLTFYVERAHRYEYLSSNAYNTYIDFIQQLDGGFSFKFQQLGLIFDFSAQKRHEKEVVDSELTFFTFGRKLIQEILDPDSDLNTRRLEHEGFDNDFAELLGFGDQLKPFVQKYGVETVSELAATVAAEVQEVLPSPAEVEDTEVALIEVAEPPQPVEPPNSSGQIVNEPPAVPEALKKHIAPSFDILVGKNSPGAQFGMLGKSIHGKRIAIDLSETNTISLFGVQGGGKSYTIGTVSEMVLKQFDQVNKLPSPLAGVIFHYSESMDYEPEFTSMIYPNDNKRELHKLRSEYGAEPDRVEDVILLTPRDKVEERRSEYPSIEVHPISFHPRELNVQDWMFLLGAIGNDSTYIKQLKAIMKEHRRNLSIEAISDSVESSELLSNSQKSLARQRLSFASDYVNSGFVLRDLLRPGRLVIVDLRDEFIEKDEALGLFVIMLNIFSSVKNYQDQHFNKFIVFDEAHKYMGNRDLTGNIVTAIREMRHKGVSIMIASQDPPSLPNEIIELSSIVLMHKFNSPQWLKHIQRSITQTSILSPLEMSNLTPGEGFLWATKATDKSVSNKPIKISTRPRVTKHGGGTIQATGDS